MFRPLTNQFLNNILPLRFVLLNFVERTFLNRMHQASLVRNVLLSIFTETIAGTKRQRSTAAGFLRGTSCCHASLASEERQGNPDCRSGTRKETEREGMNAAARVCARLCGRETGASCAFEMREAYVCAHIALPEKRVLFACDYWPRSECVCVPAWLTLRQDH